MIPAEAAPAGAILARAKVNLALHVTGRRADGYHLLDSIVLFPEIGDRLAFRMDPAGPVLTVDGPHAGGVGPADDNLVLRAARLLAAHAGVPEAIVRTTSIRLTKHLPVAAGLGGGSADAAATLRGLNTLWNLDLPAEDLSALGLRLGADVPMCLAARPARIGGIGEIVRPLGDLPALGLLLANPGIAVATPDVFRALRHRDNPPLPALPARFADAPALFAWLRGTRNDLAAPACAVAPVIAEVLKTAARLPGAAYAGMSGSGATCFALFDTRQDAAGAAHLLGRMQPDWWIAAA